MRSVDTSPFRLGSGRRGLLLVHGFVGSPFEMRPLGEALAGRGFRVHGPVLAGHAPGEDVASTGWPDWLGSVERALDALRAECDAVGVCGQSLGGLLTLELARRRKAEIAAIATLAGALWIPAWQQRGIRGLVRYAPTRALSIPKLFRSDIADREMRLLNPARAMPLAALGSLVELQAHVRARLHEIDRPALVAHGRHDHTVPHACADAIARGLSGPVERLDLERSRHVVTLDLDRDLLARRVGDFFDAHLRRTDEQAAPRAPRAG